MFDVPEACSGIETHLRDWVARPPTSFGMIMDRNVNRSTVARRLGVVCLSVLLCGVEAQAATPAQGWRIDEAQTSIGFTIDAVGFPTTHGRFAHYRGRLLIDFDRPAKSYTTFTVDAASLDVGSASFNDFVKSAVLLNVERFPTMSFASTQVEDLLAATAAVRGLEARPAWRTAVSNASFWLVAATAATCKGRHARPWQRS
jgi:polyisoprenoid-binding protein YceI